MEELACGRNFRGDGTIGDVTVVAGLKDGLDEQAIKAVRKTIFIPAIKDGISTTLTRRTRRGARGGFLVVL
jgi:hypothetical protein